MKGCAALPKAHGPVLQRALTEKWEGERRTGKLAYGRITISEAGCGLSRNSGLGITQPAVRQKAQATRSA